MRGGRLPLRLAFQLPRKLPSGNRERVAKRLAKGGATGSLVLQGSGGVLLRCRRTANGRALFAACAIPAEREIAWMGGKLIEVRLGSAELTACGR